MALEVLLIHDGCFSLADRLHSPKQNYVHLESGLSSKSYSIFVLVPFDIPNDQNMVLNEFLPKFFFLFPCHWVSLFYTICPMLLYPISLIKNVRAYISCSLFNRSVT